MMHRLSLLTSLCGLLGVPSWAWAQILPPGATPTLLAGPYNFTEGPVYDGAGGVYFTNLLFGNQATRNMSDIIRYDIASGMAQVVDPNSGGSNGLFLDHGGQVISADQGTGQISRRSAADVSVVEEVLADEWNSLGFNSPNDLVIDANGGIYFTDPNYNGVNAQTEAVYYLNSQGTLQQIITGFNRPNGIILSPGGGTLYLAVEAEKRIMAYDIGLDGLPINERQFARTDVSINGTPLNVPFGPDGMTIDAAGNVYAAVHNAVFAWNPAGERLFDLPVSRNPQNVAFGSDDGRTLFITAGNSLYGIELNVPSPQTGDYNGNGVVDAADYTVWRDTLGATENLSADGNGNRVIDAGDYEHWKDRFGDMLSDGSGAGQSASAVPEPSTVLLLVIGLAWPGRRTR
jgi:gluconolactonase